MNWEDRALLLLLPSLKRGCAPPFGSQNNVEARRVINTRGTFIHHWRVEFTRGENRNLDLRTMKVG